MTPDQLKRALKLYDAYKCGREYRELAEECGMQTTQLNAECWRYRKDHPKKKRGKKCHK